MRFCNSVSTKQDRLLICEQLQNPIVSLTVRIFIVITAIVIFDNSFLGAHGDAGKALLRNLDVRN